MSPKQQIFPMILIVFLITSFLIGSTNLGRGLIPAADGQPTSPDNSYGVAEPRATSFLSAWL